MAGVSCRASGTGHSLPCRSQKWVGSWGSCQRRQSRAGGYRQRMQAPAAPRGMGHARTGEGAAASTAAFLGRTNVSGAAVQKWCRSPRGCARCRTALPACGFGCHGWMEGRSRDGAEAGWRGGEAAKARSSEGRKHRGRSTAPRGRWQRAAREGTGAVVLLLGAGGACGHSIGQQWDGDGQGCQVWHAGAKLPFLLCLKPESCLVPPLLLLPEG